MADDITPIDHGTLITWVNEADDTSQHARELSEKARDYYDSKQWTSAEISVMVKRGQAPTVINRIKPKVDALLGMEKSAKTTAKAYPRTPRHDQAADAASEAIRFTLQDNAFDQVRSAVWEFILVEGTGGCDVVVKPQGKDFKITINSIFWDRILYDPHSRRKDFADARYLGQVVWTDYDEAVSRFPDSAGMLNDMLHGSQTYDDKPQWMETTRNRVKLVEMYYREGGAWKYTVFTRGGYLKNPVVSPYVNEEGETEHAYEFASAFVDRDGGRYGAVRQLLDVQDEINKRRSKALHLMSVRQVIMDRGSVDDINKVRQELARPDGVVEKTPEMEFEILKTGDMANAQFDLLTEAKNEIDAVGVNAALTGKDTRVISGIALQERKLAGQTELGPLFDVLRYWQLRVFRKVWNRIRQYWKEEKWIRVTDDEQNLRWVGLNKPITKGEMMLKQAQEQGAPPEMLAQLQARIASDPMMQEIIDTSNDVAGLDVDIILQEIPDTVSTQVEEFQALAEMVKSGVPIPPTAIIEASQLPHKDKLLKMMKEMPQMSPQHQAQMQKMQEDMQKLAEENQQLKTGQQEAMMKIQAETVIKDKQIQADQAEAAAKHQREIQQARAEHALQKEKQEGELQLAREKAAAEIELKVITAAADQALARMALSQKAAQARGELALKAKVQADKAAAETAEAEAGGGDGEEGGESSEEILSGIKELITSLREGSKHIAITMPDGRKASAEVTTKP